VGWEAAEKIAVDVEDEGASREREDIPCTVSIVYM
jgi:hypothetical protein